MEILVAAFIFYFVIKFAVKKAIIEAKVNESELSNQVIANKIFSNISNLVYENTNDKDLKIKSKEIYDVSFDILVSSISDEEKVRQLKIKENEMNLLKSER